MYFSGIMRKNGKMGAGVWMSETPAVAGISLLEMPTCNITSKCTRNFLEGLYVAGECLLSHKFCEFGGSFCSNPWSPCPLLWIYGLLASETQQLEQYADMSRAFSCRRRSKAAAGGWITLEGVLLSIQS
jgi:hypothetical protein